MSIAAPRSPVVTPSSGSRCSSREPGDGERRRPPVEPTKSATKSSAGWASSSAGVAYCASRPPAAKTATRSPIRTASSMSWVTSTTVLPSSRWSRRNSSCSRTADDRVDGAERLVHQQHRRVRGQRPGHADALALAAGELVRVAVGVLLAGRGRRCRAARGPAPARSPSTRRTAAGTVITLVLDLLVREQADLLDDVADAAAQLDRVGVGDVLAVEPIGPVVGSISRLIIFSVVDLPQPGRADEADHLAAGDVEVELVDGDRAVGVGLAHPVEPDHRRRRLPDR